MVIQQKRKISRLQILSLQIHTSRLIKDKSIEIGRKFQNLVDELCTEPYFLDLQGFLVPFENFSKKSKFITDPTHNSHIFVSAKKV